MKVNYAIAGVLVEDVRPGTELVGDCHRYYELVGWRKTVGGPGTYRLRVLRLDKLTFNYESLITVKEGDEEPFLQVRQRNKEAVTNGLKYEIWKGHLREKEK